MRIDEGILKAEWLAELDRTPLVQRCRAGVATRAELYTFVCQQFHYARHFTRYVAALMANLPDEDDRQGLVRNLFEEMGLAGSSDGVSHAQLYRQMMQAMGLSTHDNDVFPATRALVRTMLECCQSERFMVGLGALCLGAEAIVPHLYGAIVDGFAAIGEPRERLRFFQLHIEEDDEHAKTMLRLIDREIAKDPALQIDLDYGAARAITARSAFLRSISDLTVAELRTA